MVIQSSLLNCGLASLRMFESSWVINLYFYRNHLVHVGVLKTKLTRKS